MAAVLGVMRVLFDIGHQSYLPTLLSRKDLLQGNSAVEVVRSSGQVAGPGLGGWLTQLVGATNTLLVDAVSFLVSAACLARIRAREPTPRRVRRSGMVSQAREGFAVVLRNPVLRAIAATSAASNLLFTAATALIVLFLVDTVGFRPGTAGMLMSAAPAAALLGALLAARLARRIGSARIIWLSMAVTSPFNLLIPLTGPNWGAAFFVAGVVGGGIGQVIYGISQVTYRQATVPSRLLCRVNASMRFLVMGALPLGGLVGGALGQAIGIRPTLLVIGVGLTLAPIPLLLSPLRRVRDLDELTPPLPRGAPADRPRRRRPGRAVRRKAGWRMRRARRRPPTSIRRHRLRRPGTSARDVG
jgi:predicted MFS family arabinose efflux permease